MITKQDLEKFFENESFGKCAPFDRTEVLRTYMAYLICQEINNLTSAVNKLNELLSSTQTESTKGRKPKNKEE